MEPSVHRVKLDWSNLTYSVEVRSGGVGFKAEKSSKVILDDISGVAKPGQLVAIMGPSGTYHVCMFSQVGRLLSHVLSPNMIDSEPVRRFTRGSLV